MNLREKFKQFYTSLSNEERQKLEKVMDMMLLINIIEELSTIDEEVKEKLIKILNETIDKEMDTEVRK